MMRFFLLAFLFFLVNTSYSQLSPAVTSFIQNTTETGSYYVNGNSTAIDNGILYNCQKVEFSDDFVYVHTEGVPSYPTGPFNDGNPSQAQAQGLIYQIPLNPEENTVTPTATNPGKIGVFINGVSLYDWRDGVSWNPATQNICGGPGNPMCPGGMGASFDWNRDAIPAEREGFDCSKAHPAMGDYHHHQNPSAFKLDLDVVSDICNLYDADGLYAIDATQHSPLIGFANDGFPIYGAYGFKNANGTGDIVRIRSSYQLRDMTTRAGGPDVDLEIPNGDILFLGYFREDYEYIDNSSLGEEYLDEHNGRFCVTPEYPDGTYAYFATVDESWNSAYPYVVGPTFYGVASRRVVNSVDEATTVYTGSTSTNEQLDLSLTVFPNPSSELVAIQINDLVTTDLNVQLLSQDGKIIKSKIIRSGSTIAYISTDTLYDGTYYIKISNKNYKQIEKVVIMR